MARLSTDASCKTHIFQNGFKLIHQSVGHSHPISSVFVFIRFGSIHETELSQKGIAHFVEHMCFKGTKRRERPIDIMTPYDEIGAYINANTNKEYTCYEVKCMDKYVDRSIQVLSDMIFHSTFKKHEIQLERNVVKEETIREDDDPLFHIDTAIYKALYSGTPYSDPIDDISYHTSPDSLHYTEVLKLYKRFYQPQNIGISIVSNIPFSTVKKMISNSPFMTRAKCVSSAPFSQSHPETPIPTPQTQYAIIKKKGVNATHVSISFRTCKHGHKDAYSLQLLKNIMGGYMSSRLFMTLREKYGLTYTSSCHSIHHASSGHFEISTMCDPTKLLKNAKNPGVLLVLVDILNDLFKNGITQKELTDVKGNFRGNYLLGMEQSDTKCTYNGIEYILYDNPAVVPYERLFSTFYEGITKVDIHGVVRKYLRPENMMVCIVGEHVPSRAVVERYIRQFSV